MVKPSLALEWLVARAQRFFNALLVHADVSVLEPLNHHRIRFVFEPMHINIDMVYQHGSILLNTDSHQPASLTLTATPIQFIKTMTTQSVSDLHIAGDGKIAHALQRVMGQLNIDVEAFLETLFGGTMAHLIFEGATKSLKKAKDMQSHLIDDFADYCRYEIQTVVTKPEVDQFVKEVNELRYAVDHLSAKITQLKRRKENNHVS